MINITFGEERRDAAVQRQRQSATLASPQNQTSRPVANGNGKQQQQQQPVYRVLQHPRHLEASSPGHQGAAQQPQAARTPQAATVSLPSCVLAMLQFIENWSVML